jgi:sulfur carrier protein ThiS
VLSPAVFETAAVDRAWLPQHILEETGKKFNLRLFYIRIGLMKIKVKIVPRNVQQEVDVKKGSTVAELLRLMQLRPDAFIILKNNSPIPIDEIVDGNQELCLLQVASGG